VTKVLVLTTSAQVAPAALRQASRFLKVCSSCAQIGGLAQPEAMVEIEMIAVVE